MKKLMVTSKADDGHYHIVYTDDEVGTRDANGNENPGGFAITTGPNKGDNHTHQIIYDPPRPPTPPQEAQPPQIDPNTGQPVIDPNTGQPSQGTEATQGDPGKEVGTWIVQPADDGHTHEIMDYQTETKEEEKEDKEKIITDCLKLWEEALALRNVKKEDESEDFYMGKQWGDQTRTTLNSLDRAVLTINEILPQIDTLVGYQIEQRTDWRFLPQEGGDQMVAEMLNILVKRITDNCNYIKEETKVFKDECIVGMGVFNVYMNFNDNIEGDIIIEKFPRKCIYYGPHEKEDLSDCEFEVKDKMLSLAKIKQMFPKKAKEVEENYSQYKNQYGRYLNEQSTSTGTHMDYRNAVKIDGLPYVIAGSYPLVDIQKKLFRLMQVTRKTYRQVTVVFNKDEEFFFNAYDWKEEDISLAATLPGFQIVSQLKTRIRITKFCGNVLLSDENPADVPLHDFYTAPVYAYRMNGEHWGKVEIAKDPQREINKKRSQIMDMINRQGVSATFIEPETFIDDPEKQNYLKNRSKPGTVFTVNNLDRMPRVEHGIEIPGTLINIMQLDQQNLQRLMNIIIEPQGDTQSGSLFLERKQGRLTGNQFLFDNLSFAKQKLGKIVVALIQRYYTPERLQRILNNQYDKQAFKIGGQDFGSFSKEQIIQMLENTDLFNYDVVVAESSFTPSTRLGIAKALFELIAKGAAIPPDLPIEFIDMPKDIRDNINERMQSQSDQQAQSANDTSNSEITKTLIAKGQYTVSPEKAQELGLVPANQNMLANTPNDANNQNIDNSQATEYVNNLTSGLAG